MTDQAAPCSCPECQRLDRAHPSEGRQLPLLGAPTRPRRAGTKARRLFTVERIEP